MKNKKLLILLIIILVIIGLFVSIKVGIDLSRESKIKNEIKELTKGISISNIDDENIDNILNRRVIKKGRYAKVEDSIKEYYQTLYSDLKNYTFLIDEDNFTNYLSGTNLNEDKPSFIKSKDNLNNSKAQIDEYYEKLITELTDEQTILSYVNNKNLDNYYRNFYLELSTLAVSDDLQTNIENTYNNTINKIDVYNEALDFLVANKGHWAVKNEVIIFDDTLLYDEYVKITDKLNSSETTSEEDEVVSES